MRLDHLLSKEEEVRVVLLSSCQGVHATGFGRLQMSCSHGQMQNDKRCHRANGRARGDAEHYRESGVRRMDGQSNKDSGGDALRGHTRSHPEHDG